jgi:hypothetical protein
MKQRENEVFCSFKESELIMIREGIPTGVPLRKKISHLINICEETGVKVVKMSVKSKKVKKK